MATSASNAAEIRRIPGGVPALRAGQGHSFLWRRLQSLSGIFPVGAFLVEHFISNAYATNGAHAYNEQVRFLTSLPFVIFLEIFFIYIPIAYHAGYGLWVWWRGENNVADYPYWGNWMYTLQRYTGIVTLAYIIYHTATMRFSEMGYAGGHIIGNSDAAAAKVYLAFLNHPWVVVFYFVGIIAAAWHFGYGIWLFCAKWGIIHGERGRRNLGVVAVVVGVFFVALGVASMVAFLTMGNSPANVQALQESIKALNTGH